MISNNDQSNKEIKQLIILGNGFDLACGLKSSYSDFFKYRFEQLSGQDTINEYYSKNIKGASMEKFKKLIDESTSFWDIVFITEFINTNENKKLEWNNIEHTIYKVLHYITTNDDSTKLSDKCKNILKNVSYSFKYSEFLFNELQKFENFFGEYILSQKLDNHNYLEKDIPLKLAKIINFDILLTNLRSTQSKDLSVLSFNYTLLKDDISFYRIKDIFCSKGKEFVDSKDYTENTLDSILDNWLNIHGNAIDTSIIFGIDSNIVNNLKHSSLEYNLEIKFTKTFRVALNNSLRSINPLSKNINLITFYGHSLSSADFSYFESIFDMYNLYSSDLKLEFFYSNEIPDKSTSASSSSIVPPAYSSSVNFFFNTFNKIAVTQLPVNNATTAINGFDIAGITNTPPDGTLDPTPNVKLIAPHTPHPIEVETDRKSVV